jgi:hypothetical protein
MDKMPPIPSRAEPALQACAATLDIQLDDPDLPPILRDLRNSAIRTLNAGVALGWFLRPNTHRSEVRAVLDHLIDNYKCADGLKSQFNAWIRPKDLSFGGVWQRSPFDAAYRVPGVGLLDADVALPGHLGYRRVDVALVDRDTLAANWLLVKPTFARCLCNPPGSDIREGCSWLGLQVALQVDRIHRQAGGDIGGAPPGPPAHRHSPDFHSVRLADGKYYDGFTKDQAACVGVLWNAWEQGTPEMSERRVLEDAGCQTDRLAWVFRRKVNKKNVPHPAWGELIVSGKARGTVRLGLPNRK